jgi:hypothetical protein
MSAQLWVLATAMRFGDTKQRVGRLNALFGIRASDASKMAALVAGMFSAYNIVESL